MSETIRRGQPIELAELPEDFSDRCLRIERFEDALTRNYTNFLSEISAEKRVSEMRELVAEQMNGIADMLSELADEFQTAQKYDVEMAARVSSALKDLDLTADECSCVVDRFGRMTVEVRLSQPPEIPINRARILERLQNVCDRDFEPPEINKVGKIHYITATEKAVLSVDCACTQLTQGKNQHCGDTCRYFFDGRGRLVALLSDGMGSGGRAAVDSAMTVGLAERLIKAGFGYDCTLRLVNSAMLYKSTDESLSTLDISCIDLFNGRTELMKAGAAPTIVRRNGRTGRAECKSLPAGILHEVGFDRAVVTLKEGDVLVMMSDGASFDGTDWICAEIEAFEGDAKQLSERLATVARRRRHDGHDDDITVFAAVVEKAV
jgi:stage II sporulation protein E